jgi:hypothetical protein
MAFFTHAAVSVSISVFAEHCTESHGSEGLTFDVSGSVHHSKIHKEKSNKIQQCMKCYYSIFIWSSTCFG